MYACVYVWLCAIIFPVCVNKDDFYCKYDIRDEKFIKWAYRNIKNLEGKIVNLKTRQLKQSKYLLWGKKKIKINEQNFSSLSDNSKLAKICLIGPTTRVY